MDNVHNDSMNGWLTFVYFRGLHDLFPIQRNIVCIPLIGQFMYMFIVLRNVIGEYPAIKYGESEATTNATQFHAGG